MKLASQQMLRSMESALSAATKNGIEHDKILTFGGWEFKFARPRNPGDLPALIHALPIK